MGRHLEGLARRKIRRRFRGVVASQEPRESQCGGSRVLTHSPRFCVSLGPFLWRLRRVWRGANVDANFDANVDAAGAVGVEVGSTEEAAFDGRVPSLA